MSDPRVETLYYRRSRFATHLPVDRCYTASHYWLREAPAGVWTVGFTRFATRMLGDLVEVGFTAAPGERVAVGDDIGSLEGFKAIASIYSVADGDFLGPSEALDADITLVESAPYTRGWLYQVRGTADRGRLDVHGYAAVLDATIERMLDGRHDEPPPPDDKDEHDDAS